MNGAEYLCEILGMWGVKHVFGLFGDIQTHFAHAVQKSNIEWIGVHNEKSGGFMADIYARVSGKPGIIFTTLGPGATNLTSALSNATQDRSPLIAISDQVAYKDFNLQTHQFIDMQKAFSRETGITKYSTLVKKAKELPAVLQTAFNIANTEPKGAVHISIPVTVFKEKVSPKFISIKRSPNIFPKSTITFEGLVKRLRTKRRGLIIAGGSIERSHAEKEFSKFVEKFRLPVLTTFRGKNAIPSDHPYCLGTISRHLSGAMKEVLQEVDYILTIGYDYNEGVKPEIWKGREKDVVNIDVFDNRIGKIFSPPSLFGNIREIIKDLSSQKSPEYMGTFDFRKTKQKVADIIDEALDVRHKSLHPKRIIDAINKLYNKNAVIICDVGLNKYYSGLLLKATATNRILFSNGQSAMAFSSGAIGAKIADPQQDVIVLVGDGGFLMDLQEILTAVENKKPIICVIFNNGGLGLVEQAQLKEGSKAHGVHFSKIFFTKLAEAFGLEGRRIEAGQDLYLVLKKIKKLQRPAIIDVSVEYTPKRRSY